MLVDIFVGIFKFIGIMMIILGVLIILAGDNAEDKEKKQVPPPLPDRQGRAPRISAPAGLVPTEFPVCPICRSRNLPGQVQKVFWDPQSRTYRCCRGHAFKENGLPL